ncbi:MAG: segregation/condensation protein A [Candidatus Brocadiae bacterium]|nr:segregation/condensation protein A [Candidatus Brocadiia bacterium]
MTVDYKVKLETYYGPLDLLLHLIRESELDILNIPVARVAEQYVRHLEMMEKLDINVAGEFLVMATTLMEMKSRTLAPRTVEEEEEEGDDPRLELIQQLLQYKRYKDLGREFGRRAEERERLFARPRLRVEAPVEEEVELSSFDLAAAWARISKVQRIDGIEKILYDDTPIEAVIASMYEALKARGEMTFSELVGDRKNPYRVVAGFLASLELAKQQKVTLEQTEDFRDIRISLRPDHDAPAAPGAEGSPEPGGTEGENG